MYNRWLIAFACAWVNLFIFSVFRSAGILYLALIKQFNSTHQQAAWPVSLAGSVASTTGIMSSLLSHYFQARTLVVFGVIICSISIASTYLADTIYFVTICIGLIQGIGIGFVTNMLPAVLNSHFEDRKSIALGISYAGATIGAVIFPVIIQSLLDYYGFHGAMLIIGGLVLNGIIGGLILYKPKVTDKCQILSVDKDKEETISPVEPTPTLQPLIEESSTISYVTDNITQIDIVQNTTEHCNSTEDRKPNKFNQLFIEFKDNLKQDFKLLFNIHFVICSFTYLNFILDFVAFIIILPDVAKDQGILDVDSKWLLSIFSITDLIGRLTPGWLSFWNIITDKSTYILSITIMGLCMILLIWVQTWTQIVIVSLICGYVTGCQMVLSPAVLADHVGTENTAVAFGMSNFLCGIITLATRPLIIGVKDIYGSYNVLGYVLSSITLLSTVFWLIEILFISSVH